ncbi:TPA: YadA-like family protein [Escherichia coli]
MNKIFKVIWNPATGSYSVASETAKSRGKKSGRSKLLISALVAGGLMSSFGAGAGALDGGASIETPEEGDSWIAIGKNAKATTKTKGGASAAVAIGNGATASGEGSTAFGFQSQSLGEISIAIGHMSIATGDRSTAFGSGAESKAEYSLALGGMTYTGGTYSIAIGRDSRVEDGADYAASLGYHALAAGKYSLAFGSDTKANAIDSLAFGRLALANADGAIAMGADAQANGLYSLALGSNSIANADNTVALGYGANAAKAGAMAFGQAGKADGVNSIALGNNSQSSSENSIALGQESFAGSEKSIAIGSLSSVTGVNSVALGTGSTAVEDNTVSVGNDTLQRKVVNMAKGDISSTSTDAINGSQLYDISKSVADRLGGGASVSTAGVVNAPNYKLQSGTFNNVGDALKGIDDNTLQWDSVKKVYSAKHGSEATSKITNVTAGELNASSTDAVNGSQLKTTNDNVATNTTNISNLTGDVANNTTNITNLTNDVAANTTNITNLTDTVTNLGEDALKWDDTAGVFTAAHGTEATSKITNVTAGELTETSTDAVNGSQLKTTNDNVATNTTNITNLTGDVANNTTNITNLTDTVNSLGEDALKWDDAAGVFTAKHGTEATSKITNVTAGELTETSTDAVNGSQLKTTNDNVATNTTNITNLTGDVANNTTNITNLTDTVNSLGEDALKWDDAAGVFTAKHGTEATNKITNVTAGELTETSTDAVNGSQLKTTNDNVATNTTNISNLTGEVANNTTNITNLTNDVAANTTSITNLTDTVTNLGADALAWDDASGAFTAKHGTEATNKITNVTAGELTETSTDAVNGSQLKTTNDNVATNTTNISNLTGEVANNTTNITNLTNDVAANTTSITNLADTVTNLGADALAWDDASGAFTAKHGTEATNKITNVTAGELTETSTDAVNGSQLKTTNDNVATNTTNIATNTTNITNLADTVNNLGEDALKWDDAASAFTAAHGTEATSKITNVTAGTISSTSTDAVNGGQLFSLSDSLADYFGGNASVDENGVFTGPSYTIGSNSYDNVGDALAAINTSFSTSLGDALLWDETASAFSAGHGGNASKITNVANGAVSETSTDAINGGQLYGVSNSVVDALGGGAAVNADGSISAPTYSIADTDYNNVGDALDAIDSTLDDALLWDATAGENGAFSASRDGKASVITNVANGDISETSTDAINGSQLFATNTLINQQNEIINQIAGNTSTDYIEENGAGLNYARTNDTGLTFIDASASGTGATAVGYNAVASKEGSVAIGQNSSSSVDTGIALGSESVSSREIVKGSRNTSVTEKGVVIGYDTTDGELLGALSIGDDGKYRQIINVADGTESHDAVTVRQLQNAIGAVATTPTKYYHANSTEEDSLAVGTDSLAMGAKTIVNADAGIGIGLNTLVLPDAINGIAIGSNARANHANSIAMGNGSQTTRGAQTGYTAYNMDAPQNSVGEFSVGSEDGQRQITNVAAGSADTDAVNVGQLKVTDAQVSQNTQSITNLNTQVTNLDTRVTNIENGIGDIVSTGSTKYFKTNTDGVDANAQGKDSVAIGSGSIAAADNSVALGTGSVANEENTISVGSSTNQRRITNVAAGKNATDAVNVAQLKSSEAGGVRYDTKADGSVDYSNITLGGGNGGTTRISNVSAGVNNNDAVNYAQLKQSVQETKQYTDQRMVEMDNKLSKTESKLSGGIASAMAMTGLPQAYTPGASMASIGGGTYNGESAVALGVSMVSANGRWVYKLQGSTNSQGEYSAALGAGIQW